MKIASLAATVLTTGFAIGTGTIAPAQASTYYAGTASTGQPVQVDVDSISRINQRRVNFVYYLGEERVSAQANCESRSWKTFPENERHYPQSRYRADAELCLFPKWRLSFRRWPSCAGY